MHTIDTAIIIAYLVVIMIIGLWASRKAQGSTSDYFLGGRALPWWLLGISGMANFVDMGGTARQGAGYLLYGAKGFWFCFNGAVALLLSFQMVFVAKWLRRSGAMTNAEWMIFRYGGNKQGGTARVMSAVSALAICLALMTFFFTGTSQVLGVFVPEYVQGIQTWLFDSFGWTVNGSKVISLLFMVLVAIYTISAGFYGVIFTDFFQALLILFLMFYIGFKAFIAGTPEYFAKFAPEGWTSLWPVNGKWISEFPGSFENIASYSATAGAFGILLIFWLVNNLLQGFATPFDSWTAQRYYASRNEREASLSVCQWIALWSFRFLLMAGVGVLSLQLIGVAGFTDPEFAMSKVIKHLLPAGMIGLMLAALFAAQMSTVDSTANSSAAYFVRDIYLPYIRKGKATEREMMLYCYLTTFVLMAGGVLIGWFAPNVDVIWSWVINGIFVGTLPPNILKWFWWRSNGAGFATGVVSGLLAAVALTAIPFLKGLAEYEGFLFVFAVSAIGSVVGTLLAAPPEEKTLDNFYQVTRPFGFWGPVRKRVAPELLAEIRLENRRDLIALPVACIWQISLFLLMSSLIFKDWATVVGCTLVAGGGSICLYHLWYKHLRHTKAQDSITG